KPCSTLSANAPPSLPGQHHLLGHYSTERRRNQNTAPAPAALSKPISPPCASTISRESTRPRPVPEMPCVAASPRKNFVKTCACCSRGIPKPWSRTETETQLSSREIETSTAPPSGEYLIAFESRLATTWASRPESP